MAKIYRSIDGYLNEMKTQFTLPGNEGEGGRINSDSATRNYLAEQIQRLEDNGFDISGIKDFYDSVGGKSMDGFGNWNGSKVGGKELSVITYAMMQLDELQSNGQISVEDYAGYVNKLMSPESIEAIAGSGDDKTFTLFEDISNLADNTAIDSVQKANAEKLAVGTRPYINDVSDYLKSARTADPARDPNAERPEGYDIDEDIADKLALAKENGLLTEDQYDDARTALRNISGGSASGKEAMLYAIEDTINAGDSNMAAKLMSADGFANIVSGKDSAAGIELLREVESNRILSGNKEHSADPEPVQPTENPGATTDEPSDDKLRANFGMRENIAIMDTMSKNYFERSEADGGITMDKYAEQLAVYETLAGDEADQYYEANPDFAKANEFMNKLDRLEAGINDGSIYINTTYSSDPEQPDLVVRTYGISYPDQTGDAERANAEFGPSFLDELNTAANQQFDPDYGKEPATVGPEETDDLDVAIGKIDLSILSQQSPEERMRELQTVALDVWQGAYGHGQDRIEALKEAGYDEETRKQIQDMVNMGNEWCRNMTADDFDKAFPDPSGASMADREAAFQEARTQAAAYVMTYEGADDLKEAWDKAYQVDGPEAVYSPMEIEDAAGYYDKAAHILDDAYASGSRPDVSAEEALESTGNLADYVEENPDAGFETPTEDIRRYGEEPQEPDEPETQTEETGPDVG